MEEKIKKLSLLARNKKLREIMERICTLQEINEAKLDVSPLIKRIFLDDGVIEAIGGGKYKANITEEQMKEAIEIAKDEEIREEIEKRMDRGSAKGELTEYLYSDISNERKLYVRMKKENIPREDVSFEDKLYSEQVAVGFIRSKSMDREEIDSIRNSLSGIPGEIKKNFILKGYVHQLRKGEFLKASPVLFIDCVCVFDDEAWIIELKIGKLDHAALGQVLVYKDLFLEDYPEYSTVKMAIVCRESPFLIESVCKKFGIEVYVI